ncbi:SIR2 family protein [Kribbella sp. NPDC026596]|uniref:SIR2 family protein n=1 Tax=Kribbella sp. NPDC026596 TaxID=3155122 RepID=UPI0034045B5A
MIDIERNNSESIRLLKNAYRRRGVFLVLGAGVSFASGLPAWQELLHRLFSSCYPDPDPALFVKLTQAGMPLTVLASLLEETARNRGAVQAPRETFTELVRQSLYRDFEWFPDGVSREREAEFANTTDIQNTTLRAVSAFCVSRSHDNGAFVPNPQVKGVVTFNLDALLQNHSLAKYCAEPPRKRILRTVERPSAGSRSDKISVYHVHGYMRFDRQAADLRKNAPDQMVLTEQDYFDAFNDPTRLFNYTFLHLLREHSAVFVGLSMQDENLRRLLHYSKMERRRALVAEGMAASRIRRRVVRHVALMLRSPDPDITRAYELTFTPLGVRVLWLRSHDEIPDYLEAVYSASGEAWSDVYGSRREGDGWRRSG